MSDPSLLLREISVHSGELSDDSSSSSCVLLLLLKIPLLLESIAALVSSDYDLRNKCKVCIKDIHFELYQLATCCWKPVNYPSVCYPSACLDIHSSLLHT